MNLKGIFLNQDLLKLISPDEAVEGKLIPFFKVGDKLRLAILDPELDATKAAIERLKQEGYKLNINLASLESMEIGLKAYQALNIKKKTQEEIDFEEKEIGAYENEIEDLSKMTEQLETMQADTLLNMINLGAIKTNSSDVHIQPEEKDALLRFRVDGVLKEIFRMPLKNYDALVKQIKYESHLKFNITYLPQDGQFGFKIKGTKVDVRVSTLPTEF